MAIINIPRVKNILKNIVELCEHPSFNFNEVIHKFDYTPINDYIDLLKFKVKPETASSQLVVTLMRDVFEGVLNPEVNLNGDFIDFVVKDVGKGNPILIELKPLYRFNKAKDGIVRNEINYLSHQTQIQKYLSKKGVEYVLLTNIDKTYIFNRTALIDYKPFVEISFFQLLEEYIHYGSLWDTIRRIEDKYIPIGLDDSFFQDLKKWFTEFNNVKFIENEKMSRDEIIVLLLNKFIFIKTLEDYGLVPYRYIRNRFEEFADLWIAKGNEAIFQAFFYDIEKYIEELYNTELFSTKFWELIDKSESNLNLFREIFEIVMGFDKWSQAFGKGLIHYNYRLINEDIFGKAYETWIAEHRKDEGIFYTPATITEYMAESIVDKLFKEKIDKLIEALTQSNFDEKDIYAQIDKIKSIRIIDSTSGSGSFLIKVLRYIYAQYERINEATIWVNNIAEKSIDKLFNLPENVIFIQNLRKYLDFNEPLIFTSKMIVNHIFASDRDEKAIDTAKTNLWKEAIKLNPHRYSYRVLGVDKEHILPNLEMNFIKGDSLSDFDFSKQMDIIETEFKTELIRLFEIRKTYLNNVFNPYVIKEIVEIKDKIRKRLIDKHCFKDSLFFPLEYFFCFFSEDGEKLPQDKQGFDGIISNPPWEAIKPIKKEFAKLSKKELDILDFNKWFDEVLKKNEVFKNSWNEYCGKYVQYSNYLYGKYELQSTGDPNYYKFFMERDFQLINEGGYYCILVPSGFQTDEGSNKLRDKIINSNKLIELYSFENRGYRRPEEKSKIKLFPEVDNRFKFSIVFVNKKHINGDKYKFKAKFYLQDPKDLYNGNTIVYDMDKIKQFSPINLSIMEFRSEKDYEMCAKIKDNHKLLSDVDFKLRREFDMTNDSNLFHSLQEKKKTKEPWLELYEGKMIHQFNSSFSSARYYIDEEEARSVLFRKVKHRIKSEFDLSKEELVELKIPSELLLDYQTYRLVYRAIGSSTNERTLISSIVPPNVFIGHSMNHSVNVEYNLNNNIIEYTTKKSSQILYLMSLFNSLTLNYYIRNKVSANLTINFINELPIASTDEILQKRINSLALNILSINSKIDFSALFTENKIEKLKSKDTVQIRAELEVLIAKYLYSLSFDEWEYICSTFVFGESDTKAELDEIINNSKRIWNEL